MNCSCGHDETQHDGACTPCLCPGFTDDQTLVPTLMNGRWNLRLPPHRAYRREWTTPPYWEPERIAAMSEVIGPGDVVYDIGSEEGEFGALAALWGADVVCVEPNPKAWPNTRVIYEENGLAERVRGWFVGFAGEELRERSAWWQEHVAGSGIPYHADMARDGRAGRWPVCAYGPVIGAHAFCVLPERPDIPITTIDRLAEIHGPPTVLTMDCEGAEAIILRGAHRTLTQHRPRVFLSVHTDEQWLREKFPDGTAEHLAEYMRGLGYYGKDLALDHELHQVWQHPEGR